VHQIGVSYPRVACVASSAAVRVEGYGAVLWGLGGISAFVGVVAGRGWRWWFVLLLLACVILSFAMLGAELSHVGPGRQPMD